MPKGHNRWRDGQLFRRPDHFSDPQKNTEEMRKINRLQTKKETVKPRLINSCLHIYKT